VTSSSTLLKNSSPSVGGLVYGNTFSAGLQYHEWTSFISDTEFCFRACTGPNAAENCQHIYDVMGCFWNMRTSSSLFLPLPCLLTTLPHSCQLRCRHLRVLSRRRRSPHGCLWHLYLVPRCQSYPVRTPRREQFKLQDRSHCLCRSCSCQARVENGTSFPYCTAHCYLNPSLLPDALG